MFLLTFTKKQSVRRRFFAIEIMAIHKSIQTITSNLITDLTRPGCANNRKRVLMPSLTKVIHHSKFRVIRGMTYKYFTWDKDGKQSRNITHHLFHHPQISVIICVTALIASLKQQPRWSSAMEIIFQGITEHHNRNLTALHSSCKIGSKHPKAVSIYTYVVSCWSSFDIWSLWCTASADFDNKFGQDLVSGLRSQ